MGRCRKCLRGNGFGSGSLVFTGVAYFPRVFCGFRAGRTVRVHRPFSPLLHPFSLAPRLPSHRQAARVFAPRRPSTLLVARVLRLLVVLAVCGFLSGCGRFLRRAPPGRRRRWSAQERAPRGWCAARGSFRESAGCSVGERFQVPPAESQRAYASGRVRYWCGRGGVSGVAWGVVGRAQSGKGLLSRRPPLTGTA